MTPSRAPLPFARSRRGLVLSGLLLVLAVGLTNETIDAQPAIFKKFLGTWELVGFSQISPDGETIDRPMIGRLTYDRAGGVTAQLMPTDRQPAPPGSSAEEQWASNRRYIAYFGTWSLTPKEQRVTHHVEGSVLQSWIGLDLHRYYEFPADNLLTLSLKRDEAVVSTLTWRLLED